MTAPVRTLGVKFSADGSEAVRRAIAQVAAAAKTAADTAARAAAATARQIAETQQAQTMAWQRGVQAAERAAYAEQAIRDTAAARARATIERSSAAQMAAAQQTATTVRDKYGMMALSVSSAFNQMAFAGKTTGEGMRNVVVQTAMVATSIFGKGGPWGAAIGVGLLTVNTLFDRMKDAARETREEWRKTLRVLSARPDYAATGNLLRDLLEGDPAAEGEFEQMGLARLREMEKKLRESSQRETFDTEGRRTGVVFTGSRAEQTRLESVRAALAVLEKRYESVQEIFNRVAERQQEIWANLASLAKEAEGTGKPGPSAPTARTLAAPGRSTAVAPEGPDLSGLLSLKVKDAAKISTRTTEELIEQFRKDQSALSNGIAETLAGGIAAGIATAVTSGDIGQAIRGLASTVLAGLGDVFAEIAVKAMMQATLMIKFQAWLTANPFVALAAATAMLVLARGMGGRARSGGGSYGGGIGSAAATAGRPSETTTRIIFGQNSLALAAGMTPRQALNVTIIGPDDPNAQRGIQELLRKSQRRGDL